MREESADAVAEVLATIEELAPVLDRAQDVLETASSRLPKPSRVELEAMREREQPVTPEAFLLAWLHLATMAVENALSWLESIDPGCFLALEQAFARGEFPTDLVQFRDLAIGAGQEDLVAREGLDAALALEQARAAGRAG
jgi:hypothetical protein